MSALPFAVISAFFGILAGFLSRNKSQSYYRAFGLSLLFAAFTVIYLITEAIYSVVNP